MEIQSEATATGTAKKNIDWKLTGIATWNSFLWVLFNSFFSLIPLIGLFLYAKGGGWTDKNKPLCLMEEIEKLLNGGFIFFVYIALAGAVLIDALKEGKLNKAMLAVTVLVPILAILIGLISYFNVVTQDFSTTFLTNRFWVLAVIVLIGYCWFIKAKLYIFSKKS